MKETCFVEGCKNKNVQPDSGITFYKFPKEKQLRKKWINSCLKNGAVSNKKWTPNQQTSICNVHFVSGQKNENEWHPDYIPSVFRTLRRERAKTKTWKLLDDESDDEKPKPRKHLKKIGTPSSSAKSAALTASTSKSKKKTEPETESQSERTHTNSKHVEKNREILFEESILDVGDSSKNSYNQSSTNSTDDQFTANVSDKKRKRSSEDSCKSLSVVLERTGEKKLKTSIEKGNVKDNSVEDLDNSTHKANEQKEKICEKCVILEKKIEKFDVRTNKTEQCKDCSLLDIHIKKLKIDLESAIAQKTCPKCAVIDRKCQKTEINLRKIQAELHKIKSRISTIELNEDTFKKYKNKVKLYTGFPNYDALLEVFNCLKMHLPTSNTVKYLSPFQMFVIVLMKLKLNFPFWDLTFRFGASANEVQAFYPQIITAMESNLVHMLLWPKVNIERRLKLLATELKESFAIVQENIDVSLLKAPPNCETLNEEKKIIRVCAALFHISQLFTSNRSGIFKKILNSEFKNNIDLNDDEQNSEHDQNLNDIENSLVINDEEEDVNNQLTISDQVSNATVNTNESLELECKHLKRELENLKHILDNQFKCYSGMRNYEVFKNLLGFLQPYIKHISTNKLSHFKQLQLVLMRFKLNIEAEDVSYMFSVNVDYVIYLTRLWIDAFVKSLTSYIDWPPGADAEESERKLAATVKLKYYILLKPALAPRNKVTGRNKEKIDYKNLLKACGALYNIDDIEVFKDDVKDKHSSMVNGDVSSNEELELECRKLRSNLYDLRKDVISLTVKCFNEEALENNDKMVQFYTGFQNFETLYSVFNYVCPIRKQRKTATTFEQFFMMLIRMRLNISLQDIGFRFGLTLANVSKTIQEWLLILHSRLSLYITWPDDDDDVQLFTDMLRKTYAYLSNISPRSRDKERTEDCCSFDVATLVCAGLFNIGNITLNDVSDSDFDDDDDDDDDDMY